jgi:hypothetical protein
MGLNNFRTTRGVAGFTDLAATKIDADTLDALELIDGSARKRPTEQLQSRSALSAPTNAESVVYARAPVDDEATQGTESVLTLLQSGIDPAMVMRRELDGQGGAYQHQLDAALGRFARLNANLSFEYETLADVPNWNSISDGISNFTFNVNGRPRRIRVEHDGSGGSNSNGGVQSSVLATSQSLNRLAISFHNVSFTNNAASNRIELGLSNKSTDTQLSNSGDGILLEHSARNGTTGGRLVVVNNGNSTLTSPFSIDWNKNQDITFQYDGSVVTLLIDGVEKDALSFSTNSDYRPVIKLRAEDAVNDSEILEVGQITVEPIGGTF